MYFSLQLQCPMSAHMSQCSLRSEQGLGVVGASSKAIHPLARMAGPWKLLYSPEEAEAGVVVFPANGVSSVSSPRRWWHS